MKHLRKRLLAVFLAAVMLVTSVGTSSYAYEAEKKVNLSVTGNDGKTIEEEGGKISDWNICFYK